MNRAETGRRGEAAAARWYQKQGAQLLEMCIRDRVCAVLAFRFAVPLQAQTPQTLPDTKELAAYTQVELNLSLIHI